MSDVPVCATDGEDTYTNLVTPPAFAAERMFAVPLTLVSS
jgi:hypothetical protein